MLSTEGADAAYYRWDFGDGSDIEWTTDPTVEHQYQSVGSYQARVEVMDEYGHKVVSQPVTVQIGYEIYLPLVTK
jgi:PKD repeat protein